MISESYKNRIKKLSGIRLTEIEIKAISGRSDKNTMSFFIEEYLINISEIFLEKLKKEILNIENIKLEIDKTNNKISNNSILINFKTQDQTDINNIKEINFSINFIVKIESGSNTVAILKHDNIIDEFNLQSKHSNNDIQDFLDEIVTRIFNIEKDN